MINKRNEFLTKLANLLDEYNADIEFTCSEGSDTSGLYDDRIIISERKTEKVILDTFNEWYLSGNVIKENM
jgi:hypothetical protein